MRLKKLHILWIALVLFSCSDALDMAPDGRLSLDEIFEDNEKVAAYLNSCYELLPSKGCNYFFWSRGPVVWSDDAWDTDAEAESWIMSGRLYNGDASASNHPVTDISDVDNNGSYWSNYWSAIRKANVFINQIDDAKVNDPIDKERWEAEAHLLRAFFYSELLMWYGGDLPIVRETFSLKDDFSKLERYSFYDIVEFVIEDCNIALDADALPWRITIEDERGRFTKAVAEAIKSRMSLFAASPLYNDGNNYWQEAYEINKSAFNNLKNNGYELYNKVHFPQTFLSDNAFIWPDESEYDKSEYAALYNEYFVNEMEYTSNPADKETIYQHLADQGPLYFWDGVGAQSGYRTGTCPSQELVDAYETVNGKPVLDLANPYADLKKVNPNYNSDNSLYDENSPYDNRDPRFYASIYYNGSKRKAQWGFDEPQNAHENYPASSGNRIRYIMTYVGEPHTGIDRTERSKTRTGYYQRKFLHPNSGMDLTINGARWKTFRLGEVILNYAEAAAEAGHLTDAYDAVNEIRDRVGMPALPENLSREELILRIRNERRVELAMEGHRYFDVRRWTSPTSNLEETDKWVTAMEITREGEWSFNYNRRTVRNRPRENYTNKYLRLPIPLDEANRLGSDWQRPGW